MGNIYGTATSHGCLLESRPARHSVTLTFCLGHLPFLLFQISEESNTRSQYNYARKTPILIQMKSGEASKTISITISLVRRLQIFGQGAQLGNKYRFCMGMTEWPTCAMNFDTILSCLVLLERKSIDVSWELPVKLLLPEHTKCKRQASVRDCTKSDRRRFQTQDVSYLERHLTTQPHETHFVYV